MKTCELFESYPELGGSRDELSPGIRLITCRGYGLYYRVDEERGDVKLLRILHPFLDVRRIEFD